MIKSVGKASVQDAVACIRSKSKVSPSIGVIAGSGWDFKDLLEIEVDIPYEDIPGFPRSIVAGHINKVIAGYCKNRDIIIFQGRVHYYEGYSMEEITFPVEVLSALGVSHVITTNAAGGIRPYFKPGDFMLITDHINMIGANPLRGKPNSFIDMTDAYDRDLINRTLKTGFNLGIMLHCGILAGVAGPSYETPAEIHMLRMLGADAVCMSTVPEVIMCRYLGIKVLGISIITNYAAGLSASPLTHEEVIRKVESRREDAGRLLSAVIEEMPR